MRAIARIRHDARLRCARPSRSPAGPPTRRPSWSPSSSATGSSRAARARRSTTGARRPTRIVAALEADGAALLGDDLFAGEAISRRVAAWDGPQGAKMALDGVVHDWLGKRVGQPVWRLLGTERRDAADLVHDRHRHGRGHRRPDAPRDGLRGAQDQGRRAGRPRAAAGRARGDRRAAADRRQRGLGPRHGPRADARADRRSAWSSSSSRSRPTDLDAFRALPRRCRRGCRC